MEYDLIRMERANKENSTIFLSESKSFSLQSSCAYEHNNKSHSNWEFSHKSSLKKFLKAHEKIFSQNPIWILALIKIGPVSSKISLSQVLLKRKEIKAKRIFLPV